MGLWPVAVLGMGIGLRGANNTMVKLEVNNVGAVNPGKTKGLHYPSCR